MVMDVWLASVDAGLIRGKRGVVFDEYTGWTDGYGGLCGSCGGDDDLVSRVRWGG